MIKGSCPTVNIKIGSVIGLCNTPVSPSVREMEGIHASKDHPFFLGCHLGMYVPVLLACQVELSQVTRVSVVVCLF